MDLGQAGTCGFVVFDDYGFDVCGGITQLVNEMLTEPDRIVIHNLNGHAIVIKTGPCGYGSNRLQSSAVSARDNQDSAVSK